MDVSDSWRWLPDYCSCLSSHLIYVRWTSIPFPASCKTSVADKEHSLLRWSTLPMSLSLSRNVHIPSQLTCQVKLPIRLIRVAQAACWVICNFDTREQQSGSCFVPSHSDLASDWRVANVWLLIVGSWFWYWWRCCGGSDTVRCLLPGAIAQYFT